MTFRRLCRSLALLLLLRPPAAPAVEALTTTVEEVNARKKIPRLKEREAVLTRQRDAAKATLDEIARDPDVIAAFDEMKVGKPGATMLTPDDKRFKSLDAEKKKSVDRFQEAEAAFAFYQNSLKQTQAQTHDLQAIPISANVQINSGGSASAVVPGIDASGSFPISNSLGCQMLFSIKPDPPAGTTADVAQSIRMSTGVFSANLGLNYANFRAESDTLNGPLGVEARLGLPVAYQRAASTDPPASGQASTSSRDFGLLSPEIKVSVWLKYVLLGYKYVYYFAFGNPNPVYEEIDRTGSHRIYLAAKLQALSGSDKTPFYVEANYVSGKNGFSGGAFSFAVSKSLSWDPR
ncbi:MAG TPA: hypothetical protein PLB01_05350 [Thermoanaerobaculia bacterium]|nr:hypothetical protein [Thermoanaerobaculia bacterium]